MNDKRPISFSTKFAVLRGNKPFFLLGVIFTVLSIFILTPLLIGITVSTKAPYENYDFKAIEKNGNETTAQITAVETLYNTTVNGQHPKVISYTYYINGQPFYDQFKTLMAYNDAPLNVKDEIKIMAYKNQSVIKGMKPFIFPYYFFYFLPLIFLIVGLALLTAGLVPALKKLSLYRYGTVREATMVAMQPVLPHGKNKFSPYLLVDYYYLGMNGQKISGKSSTHNMLILNTKQPTDKIKIFVSEEDETRSCLVPMEVADKNGWAV